MANRYWVGGTGTWNTSSTTNWSTSSGGSSGASVPTASDSVFFDQAGTYTVTCTGALTTLDFTVSAGSVSFVDGTSPTFAISGSISLTVSTVWTATGTLTFNATTTGKTINTNNVQIYGEVSFNGVGGGWTLASGLTCVNFRMSNGTVTTSASNYSIYAVGVLYLTGGTLTLNGSTITASSLSGAATSVSAGTSTLVLTSTGATVTAAASWYNVTLNATSGSGKSVNSSVTISNTLTVYGHSSALYMTCTLGSGSSIGAISTSGTAGNRRVYFSGGPSTISLTTTGSSCTDADFYNITFTTNTLTGTRLGDRLNNSGITFSTPKTVYWNLAGSQDWTADGWAATSGGTPATTNFPLPQDTAIFDNTGSAGTVTLNQANLALPSIDFSSRTSAMTFATSYFQPIVYGNLTLGSGVTISGTGILHFQNAATKTITSAGKTWTQGFSFDAGSTQLGDAFTLSAGDVLLTGGTLNTAGYSVTSVGFTASTSAVKTLTLGATTWTITGSGTYAWYGGGFAGDPNFTVNRGTSTINMTSASLKYFYPAGKTWGVINQGGSGTLQITGSTGSTFANLTNTVQPATIQFIETYTYFFDAFSISGTAGNLVSLSSTTNGNTFTLSKVGGGTVSCNYLSIRDSTATGASASWYAGANSTNVSNNTGWIFTNAPSGGMLFFFN